MKKVLFLTLSLGVSFPCLSMTRVSQPTTNRLLGWFQTKYRNYHTSPLLSQEAFQKIEAKKTELKIRADIKKQYKILENADKRFNKRSWYEWFTGKSSRFDNRRREKALLDQQKASDNLKKLMSEFKRLPTR